jgi:hypothetical protein
MTDTKQTGGRAGQGDGSTPSVLDVIARSRSKEFLEHKRCVEESPYHPTEELLREYVLDQLDESEAEIITDHLSLCDPCAREALRLTWKLENQTESLWTKISDFVSSLSVPVSIYAPALESVRGVEPEPQERCYTRGTDLVISIEAPADGYMTVFHGCEETQKVELVFPLESDDDPRVLAGKEISPIAGTVEGPAGKQWLRVFWTREMIMDPTAYRLEDVLERERASEAFLDAMEYLDKADFAIGTWEYTVVME